MGNECAHEHAHLNNEVTGDRFCNDCQQEFGPADYSGPHLERWRMVDEFTSLMVDNGYGQESIAQVWEMLDTRTVEQLRILHGNKTGG